jgi:succinyl-CoA synthetase beta subunit
MRLYEFEGAELFKREGIPVPDFALATSAAEAREKALQLGLPVVIKAQVLTGGRYLAGGVQTATKPQELDQAAKRVFAAKIRNLPVERAMVAKQIKGEREFYLAITLDDFNGVPVAILSSEGGVGINTTAQERPEVVVSRPLSISSGLRLPDAFLMCQQAGLNRFEQEGVASVLVSLYDVFKKYDALIAEINPLIRTEGGQFMAVDSKVEIDDSSIYRHADLNLSLASRMLNPLERKGKEIGVTYVELEGDIAMISSGAGLGMASMDIISRKMKPANFLETGGAITEDLLYKVTDLVLQKPGVKALFINVYGGINPIHEGAKGVVHYLKEHNIGIPVVAKALGNHQEETWEIFKAAGVYVVDDVSTERGIEMVAELLGNKK